MIHNALSEMYTNAKLFYDVFRGLCRMRIAYAKRKQKEYRLNWTLGNPDERNKYMDKEKFWHHVQEYWQNELKESIQWEKDYFATDKPL